MIYIVTIERGESGALLFRMKAKDKDHAYNLANKLAQDWQRKNEPLVMKAYKVSNKEDKCNKLQYPSFVIKIPEGETRYDLC